MLEEILDNLADLEIRATKIQKGGEGEDGLLSFIKSFLFDTTFGTSEQLRCKLQLDYTAKRIFVPVEGDIKVDAMIILPRLKTS